MIDTQPAAEGVERASKRRPAEPAELAIVGAVPPPFGGVTIHIRRLAQQFRERGMAVRIINLNSRIEQLPAVISWRRRTLRRVWTWLIGAPESAVVIMNKRLLVWAFFALVAWLRRQRIVIRLQGSDLLDWRETRSWKYRWATGCLRRVSGVVCVNEPLRAAVLSAGVPADRLLLMPGFLPPAREELEPTLIDPGTSEFLARHRPIVAANGKVAWHQGEDLYGLDMLVGILEGLSAEYPELGVVVCLSPPARREREYLDALRARAMARGCGERFWVRTTDGFFLPILVRASLFVRPTNTEGDSNSVREALSLGIPTVASDVAPRPPGSVLFRNRDQADLNEKVRRLLSGAGCVDPAADQEKDRTRAGVDQYLEFLLGRPLARSLAEAVDS